MAINKFVKAILNNDELVIFGNGMQTRDFTYVDDTVAGFISSAESSVGLGEVFNLGTGEEIRIGDLANKVIAMVGREVQIDLQPERLRPEKSEVMRLIFDNRRAREVLGWKPKVSLEEGLKRTMQWISENIGQYRVGKYEF